MFICVAGDIHGAMHRLYEDILAFEASLGVRFDYVLHVGDFVWLDEQLKAGRREILPGLTYLPSGDVVDIGERPRADSHWRRRRLPRSIQLRALNAVHEPLKEPLVYR